MCLLLKEMLYAIYWGIQSYNFLYNNSQISFTILLLPVTNSFTTFVPYGFQNSQQQQIKFVQIFSCLFLKNKIFSSLAFDFKIWQ